MDTEKYMACLEEEVISVCFLLGNEQPRYDLQGSPVWRGLILLLVSSQALNTELRVRWKGGRA